MNVRKIVKTSRKITTFFVLGILLLAAVVPTIAFPEKYGTSDWTVRDMFWIEWIAAPGIHGWIGYGVVYTGSNWYLIDDAQNMFKWTNGYVATSGLTVKLEGHQFMTYYNLKIYILTRGTNDGDQDDFEWDLVVSGSGWHDVVIQKTISPSELRQSYLFPSDVPGYSPHFRAKDLRHGNMHPFHILSHYHQ